MSLKLDFFFYMQYFGQCLSYFFQTWHDARLMDDIYAHGRFYDLGRDARSQWVGKSKKNQSCECCRQLNKR